MASAEGGAERWWEKTSLNQSELRQHGESWSLAADTATATLLQSISQRLVSRTHEVEGTLKKILEDTDRLVTSIANTNNSFHQLANTQFIENRTYQDVSDMARDVPEKKEKVAPTEEEVLAQCRAAISGGLALVNRSYERHEIQDSDSDEEDSPSSPVPVYALINPYEMKSLPYIIGSEPFMEDDRIGLQETSSEENSKVTLSPEDTESEDELDVEDEASPKDKTLPATSSRLMDDSDSDWSDDEVQQPIRTSGYQPQATPISNGEEEDDEDDEDDDFFGPPSRPATNVKNGASLSAELSKKLQGNARKTIIQGGYDSDSDEDGDLFGRRPEPSMTTARAPISHIPPPVSKSFSGVENVRAMPDPSSISRPPPVTVVKKQAKDLFASDSDDGDLFKPEPPPITPKSKDSTNQGENNVSRKPETPSIIPTNQVNTSSLFSSDGGDDDDEGGLFSSKPPPIEKVIENDNDDKDPMEKPSPQVIPNKPKIPVGGVNIFGSAITSSLRRRQSSGSEQSNNEDSDWGTSSRSSSMSTPKREKTGFKQESQTPQTTPALAKPPPVSSAGLFDEDDDDNDLFGNISRKTEKKVGGLEATKRTAKAESVINTDHQVVKKEESNKVSVPKKGIFSDDDEDDLFSVSSRPVKKPESGTSTISKKPTNALFDEPEDDMFNTTSSKTPVVSNETPKSSVPIKVPDVQEKNTSLFSSPSDEDDLFAIPPSLQKTKRPSTLMDPPPLSVTTSTMEPPPLPVTASTMDPPPLPVTASKPKATNDLFGSPISDDEMFASKVTAKPTPVVEKDTTLKSRSNDDSVGVSASSQETKAPAAARAGSLFSFPSDEEDLFAKPNSTSGNSESTKVFSMPPPILNSTNTSQKPEEETDIFGDDEDLFAPKVNVEVTEPLKNTKPSMAIDFSSQDMKQNQTTSQKSLDSNQPDKDLKKPLSRNSGLFISSEEGDISRVGKQSTKSDVLGIDSSSIIKTNIFDDGSDGEDIFSSSVATKQKQPTTKVTTQQQPTSVTTTQKQPTKVLIESSNSLESSSTQSLASSQDGPSGGDASSQDGPSGGDKSQEIQSSATRTPDSLDTVQADPPSNVNVFNDEVNGISEDVQSKRETTSKLGPTASSLETERKSSSHSNSSMHNEDADKLPDANIPRNISEVQQSEKNSEIRDTKSGAGGEEEVSQEETKAVKRRKPAGGVSLFGGSGGFGGNELFAKVNKRRTMLGVDSDEEEKTEEKIVVPTKIDEQPSKQRSGSETKPLSDEPKSQLQSSKGPGTASHSKGTLPALSHTGRNPGVNIPAEESSVSFNEPASTKTLESLNKRRAKGSIKRRPPSRAHRRGESDKSEQVDIEPARRGESDKSEQVDIEPPTGPKTCEPNVEEGSSATSEPVTVDSIFSNNSAISSKKPRAASLFGENDSDDEDLFGASKSSATKNVSSVTKVPASGQDNLKSNTPKAPTTSLFGDDDDDLFSGAPKTETSTARKVSVSKTSGVSVSKPKVSTLQASSEPFDDPLLGPRK